MQDIFHSQNKELQHRKMQAKSAIKCERERGDSSRGSGYLYPLAKLPSPSMVAARAYASRVPNPTGWEADTWSGQFSLTQMQQFPRRHSAMVTLAEHTESLSNNSSLATTSPCLQITPKTGITSESLKESEAPLVIKGASVIGTLDARRHFGTPAPSISIHRVPFQYTHDRLQTWGHAYFGNSVTADAFVNAVSLRRASLVTINEQELHESLRTSDQVMIRARVLPKVVERKPFLIQRQFDIRELRDSIPASRFSQDHARGLTAVRRSSRLRRLSLQGIPNSNQHGTIHNHFRRKISTNHVAVPIHIEYALHYLPALAALMLSGHVRKGDSIDLPLPNPEAWVDTTAYIYTGQGEITSAMKENILFLAGRVKNEG